MEKDQDFIAHVRIEDNAFQIQTVKEHAVGTAGLSESFASVFGAAAWGKQNGWWHDMGKYTKGSFQPYIRSASGMTVEQKAVNKPDHSSAGAILAKEKLPGYYQPLAYCIAGHHSGLLDWTSSGEANLNKRLSKTDCYQEMLKDAPEEMQEAVFSLNAPMIDDFQKEMHQWIRMLFSCLVDADYLDTERFMQPEQAVRRGQYDSMETLKERFDTHMESLTAGAPASFINEKRAAILSRCREMAEKLPGFFSLTVPTGGGKTLASMAWALIHAVRYKKDRIIIVIPYTSIIVQTAAVLRDIFGAENVVEHHSNLQPDSNDERSPSLLATENWDAPIIVTTNVQFFESLYACRTSRCRKLHNICNSVVILDEAQMLPVEFLQPILDILQSLQSSFKTSILFTTATLPVFAGRIGTGQKAFSGLKSPVTEITSVHDNLFEAFKRVELHWPESTTTFDDLADELSGYDCVLCIVNTRKEARELYQRMPEGTLHLSRMMCSVHIMEVIKLIKQKLKDNESVRVISTQLVEAGVDIDFPVVYRAFAGLDSIIQAAGRCNREGKLNKKGELGQVFVFKPENNILRGLMGKGAAALREMLLTSDGNDLFSPDCMAQYFRLFYSKCNTFDKAEIKKSLYEGVGEMNFLFATAADQFRLIDDKDSVSILVGYGDGATLLEELKRIGPEFWLLRKLQQYSVSVRKWDFEQFRKQGTVGEYAGIFILEDGRCYDERAGLVLDGAWVEELLLK